MGVRGRGWRVVVLISVVLSIVLITVDATVNLPVFGRWPLLFGSSAAGARGLLTAVAGSMITVAGVVFSTTLVARSLTSSQYTSRVIRTFMSDRVTQAVLGVFVDIFAYSLVVLRTRKSVGRSLRPDPAKWCRQRRHYGADARCSAHHRRPGKI